MEIPHTKHGISDYECQETACEGERLVKALTLPGRKQIYICPSCNTGYLRGWDKEPYFDAKKIGVTA